MLKKTMTYNDVDGNPVTEAFYFNLTKAELTLMELTAPGGSMKDQLMKIVEEGNAADVISTFHMILEKSYGIRSEDGRRFIKSHQLWEEFVQTEAYSDLFMMLCTDAKFGGEFINAVIPAELRGSDTPAPGTQPTPKLVEDVNSKNIFETPQDEVIVGAIVGAIVPGTSSADDVLAGMSEEQKKELRDRLINE